MKLKTGAKVRVIRPENAKAPLGKFEAATEKPTIGTVVFIHPLGRFVTVEFPDKRYAEYQVLYRECFKLDHIVLMRKKRASRKSR